MIEKRGPWRRLTRQGLGVPEAAVAPAEKDGGEDSTRRLSRVQAELDASLAELRADSVQTGKTTPGLVTMATFQRSAERLVLVVQREADRLLAATALARALMMAVAVGVGVGLVLCVMIIALLVRML